MTSGRLEGKVALISAAAQGIGAATAEAMAREGATVVVTDIQGSVSEVAEKIGGRAIVLDATEEDQWISAAKIIDQEIGRLDILVNNVGWAIQKPFWEYSVEEFQRHFIMNSQTAFLGAKSCLPLLEKGAERRSDYSSIVNVASIAAVLTFPAELPYNASKAAVASMSRSMAVDLAKNGKKIRSNCVMPGAIDTAILENWFEQAAEHGVFGEGTREQLWQNLVESSPMKMLGKPSDIASAIVYFASDESRYANGTEVRIDGGWTA